MWQLSEGLLIIIAVIFFFGLISLPPPSKKPRTFHDHSTSAKDTSIKSPVDSGAAMRAALADGPTSYMADQKTASPSKAQKVI